MKKAAASGSAHDAKIVTTDPRLKAALSKVAKLRVLLAGAEAEVIRLKEGS